MASSLCSSNPQPAPGGGVTLPPSPEKIQQKFDLSIALVLSAWSALTLSVQNSWGGPLSSEKRDWFAGAISDLFSTQPANTIDVEYLEEFLLRVMNDEFEVNVEDDSGAEIASKIVGLRKLTLQGNFGMVDEMYEKWREREAKGGERVRMRHVQGEEDDDSIGEDYSEDDEEDEDVDMGEASRVPKEKVAPKIDEDGFMEVVGRRKR
ncbi:MAG: hypothetical protein L6R41_003819 [Letrouitia leprolyta]|nr:MAG: hypothetical protein L6R41_003819 [Letrouitia leprolyta]